MASFATRRPATSCPLATGKTRTVHTNDDGSRTITVRTGMHHGLVRVERVTVV